MLTRRDYVIETLRHRKTDKLPYFLDIGEDTTRKMRAYTGDDAFFEHSDSYIAQKRNESFTDLEGGRFRDMFGVVWDKGAQEGDFGIVAEYPLKDADFGDFVFPEPDEALIREKCTRLAAQKDKFTMYIIGFSLFERAWTLRGMENLLCDMLEEPEFVDELLRRIVIYNKKVIDIVAEYSVDCVFFGDDWGQQRGLIMGLPLWKRFMLPFLKEEYEYVKQKGMYVAQHSCGDCVQTFPYLIDIGLDIYNTFQPEVYDIEYCKRVYGDKLTFFGGISTQRLLPFATPEGVEAEMERIIKILEPNGGYILAPTHAMPGDIPPENVMAFLRVARKHGEL